MISAIVAVDNDWGIGYDGNLLERIPEDMKMFRELTENNIVIMGRKTWDSLPGLLPNRVNIVISSTLSWLSFQTPTEAPYIANMKGIERDLAFIHCGYKISDKDIFIIGGGQIYKQLLPYCDQVYVTKILKNHENIDTFFPNLDKSKEWEIDTCTELRYSNDIPYAFLTYKRV